MDDPEPHNGPRQTFAIDFDGTFSADPPLWRSFAARAIQRGHAVYVVTCRRKTDDNLRDIQEVTGLEHWRHKFTALEAKKAWCEKNGLAVSVWVDDEPQYILHGR